MRADVYERMRAIIDGATKRAGWDDPALDAYEQYRKMTSSWMVEFIVISLYQAAEKFLKALLVELGLTLPRITTSKIEPISFPRKS